MTTDNSHSTDSTGVIWKLVPRTVKHNIETTSLVWLFGLCSFVAGNQSVCARNQTENSIDNLLA